MRKMYEHVREWCAQALDVIAPRSTQTLRTVRRRTHDIPLNVSAHKLLDTDITTIMHYRDSAVLDLVWSLKYDGTGRSAEICAEILAGFLEEEVADAAAFSPRRPLIVPIPLHESRRRERGFNQIESVLKHLPARLRDGTVARYAPDVLSRTRATAQQARLARHERIRNVRDAFAVRDAAAVRDAHVFLIDDVATTGATLVSAAQALKRAGARVTPVALARAGQ